MSFMCEALFDQIIKMKKDLFYWLANNLKIDDSIRQIERNEDDNPVSVERDNGIILVMQVH